MNLSIEAVWFTSRMPWRKFRGPMANARRKSSNGGRSTSYFPLPPNRQTLHEQDELHVIVRGNGVLVHDSGNRETFATGDIIVRCGWS